ncbi:MAG TPA: rod shape-determining protein MreD [Pseudomonadales bacterium]|nr:rod shape-determining protein MreD [Pseudomonadales bacterium]
MEMVVRVRANGLWVIPLTVFVAMILSVVSLPEYVPAPVGYLRPEWVALVLIYWVIALPQRVGVVTAWCIGLLMDVLLGDLLGQHAIAYMIIAYIGQNLYQRLRMFTVWQQSLIVFAIVGLNQLINFWIESIAGTAEWSMWYLLPSVVSALLWPWVFLILRYMRRVFNVT